MSLFVLLCFKSCKSQSKEELTQFDLNEPKRYYSNLGELRGKIKEIIETSTSKLDSPMDGIRIVNHESKSVFDNDKHIIYQYDKTGLLYLTMYFDSKWLLDSTKDHNMRVCCPFKTPFHCEYNNYYVEKGVKSLFNNNKIDSVNRTVSTSFYNKISSIDSFDVNNRKVQIESFDLKDTFWYLKYNSEGDLIGSFLKRPYEELMSTESNEYEYDQNKNWIKQINLNNPKRDGYTLKTTYERKIIYSTN